MLPNAQVRLPIGCRTASLQPIVYPLVIATMSIALRTSCKIADKDISSVTSAPRVFSHSVHIRFITRWSVTDT